jgi:hypothetical protein
MDPNQPHKHSRFTRTMLWLRDHFEGLRFIQSVLGICILSIISISLTFSSFYQLKEIFWLKILCIILLLFLLLQFTLFIFMLIFLKIYTAAPRGIEQYHTQSGTSSVLKNKASFHTDTFLEKFNFENLSFLFLLIPNLCLFALAKISHKLWLQTLFGIFFTLFFIKCFFVVSNFLCKQPTYIRKILLQFILSSITCYSAISIIYQHQSIIFIFLPFLLASHTFFIIRPIREEILCIQTRLLKIIFSATFIILALFLIAINCLSFSWLIFTLAYASTYH